MRILIVDDSEMIRKAVGGALTGVGHECDYGPNGVEGLRLGLRQGYDLILTDIQMPVMDGLKFIQRIRMSGPNCRTPILVFSSCRTEETVILAGRLGVQGYVLKPIDRETLLATVESTLELHVHDV